MKLISSESRDLIRYPGANGLIMKMSISLHETYMIHEKSLYGVFDLLADVGGLLDLFIVLLAILFERYNTSLFLFNAIYKLY